MGRRRTLKWKTLMNPYLQAYYSHQIRAFSFSRKSKILIRRAGLWRKFFPFTWACAGWAYFQTNCTSRTNFYENKNRLGWAVHFGSYPGWMDLEWVKTLMGLISSPRLGVLSTDGSAFAFSRTQLMTVQWGQNKIIAVFPLVSALGFIISSRFDTGG